MSNPTPIAEDHAAAMRYVDLCPNRDPSLGDVRLAYLAGRMAERQRAARVAKEYEARARERGPMLGGAPMHGREIRDREMAELVSGNIAAEILAGPHDPSPE